LRTSDTLPKTATTKHQATTTIPIPGLVLHDRQVMGLDIEAEHLAGQHVDAAVDENLVADPGVGAVANPLAHAHEFAPLFEQFERLFVRARRRGKHGGDPRRG